MCGRFVQKDVAAVERYFEIRRSPGWQPSFNVAPSQRAAMVRLDASTGATVLDEAKWGFVPAWVADPAKWPKPINGRIETVFEKPAWRTAIRRSRCLVPADGWYEWKSQAGRKQPFYLQAADGEPLALAGVWDRWGEGEDALTTFAVLVGPAPQAIRDIHDRAPVALHPDDWRAWLDADTARREDLEALIGRGRVDFRAWPVSTRVNRPRHNDATLIEAVEAGAD